MGIGAIVMSTEKEQLTRLTIVTYALKVLLSRELLVGKNIGDLSSSEAVQ